MNAVSDPTTATTHAAQLSGLDRHDLDPPSPVRGLEPTAVAKSAVGNRDRRRGSWLAGLDDRHVVGAPFEHPVGGEHGVEPVVYEEAHGPM